MKNMRFSVLTLCFLLTTTLSAQRTELGFGFNALLPQNSFRADNFTLGGGFHLDFFIPIRGHDKLFFGVRYSLNGLSQHSQEFRENINVAVNSRYNEVWPAAVELTTRNELHQVLFSVKYFLTTKSLRPFAQVVAGLPWAVTRTTFHNESVGPLEGQEVGRTIHRRSFMLSGGIALGLQWSLSKNASIRLSGTYIATSTAAYLTKSQIEQFEYAFTPSVQGEYDLTNPEYFRVVDNSPTFRRHSLQFIEVQIGYILVF